MEQLYDTREIYFLKPESNVSLFMQTAFINSAVDEKSRKGCPWLTSLSGREILKYRLHLVQDFNHLKLLCREMFETTTLASEPAKLILHYLYNIRNSQTEIKEMSEAIHTEVHPPKKLTA